MRNVELVMTAASPVRLLRLSRIEPGDGYYSVHHIFRTSYWDFGARTHPQWSCSGSRNEHGEGWCYLFLFADRTFGVSRVTEVNEALSQLGYAVDRRGDAA